MEKPVAEKQTGREYKSNGDCLFSLLVWSMKERLHTRSHSVHPPGFFLLPRAVSPPGQGHRVPIMIAQRHARVHPALVVVGAVVATADAVVVDIVFRGGHCVVESLRVAEGDRLLARVRQAARLDVLVGFF